MFMQIKLATLVALGAVALIAACGSNDDGSAQATDALKHRLCHNGKIDSGEQCDGNHLNKETCSTITLGAKPYGKLGCSQTCQFDTTHCSATASGGGAGGGGGSGGASTGGSGGVSHGDDADRDDDNEADETDDRNDGDSRDADGGHHRTSRHDR
jgi:hypothetical protein